MNYLLNGVTLLETLTKVEFLTSIILGSIGLAIICLAKRITKTIRKTNFIMPDDKIFITIKVVGLILVVIAFIVLMISSLMA
ncbi:MAG: hypothetical protein E7359_01930 [Clostridiales bacterium]|nr:hypothetical protein [Clostridiales bacterium]